MSELTPCNHCNLKRIEATAKRNGRVVVKVTDHRRGINIYMVKDKKEPLTKNNFAAWFAELPTRCVC